MRLATRTFGAVVDKVLFNAVVIHGKDECGIKKFNKFFYVHGQSFLESKMPWVKHLSFCAPLQRHLRIRCPDQLPTGGNQPYNSTGLKTLGTDIMEVIRRLPDDNLRSFRQASLIIVLSMES